MQIVPDFLLQFECDVLGDVAELGTFTQLLHEIAAMIP